jgi:hypothetical protein
MHRRDPSCAARRRQADRANGATPWLSAGRRCRRSKSRPLRTLEVRRLIAAIVTIIAGALLVWQFASNDGNLRPPESHEAGETEAALQASDKAIPWSPKPPPSYTVEAARLRYSVKDYDQALASSRQCMDRAPASAVCKAIWLSSMIRTGRLVEAQAAWPSLVAAVPSLQTYRRTSRHTAMARSVNEDLDTLRSSTRAMAR